MVVNKKIQRTEYDAYKNNKSYTRRNRKNCPDYQDNNRDDTGQHHKMLRKL